MNSVTSRLLLASAAAIFLFGAAMHTIAYAAKASRLISSSGLSAFFASELKVLWLADSTTLFALSLVIALIAANPKSADKVLVMLLALVPFAITLLLYAFVGPFYAGHLLLIASAMVFAAGLIMPARSFT